MEEWKIWAKIYALLLGVYIKKGEQLVLQKEWICISLLNIYILLPAGGP
jgi:hypothetical protein